MVDNMSKHDEEEMEAEAMDAEEDATQDKVRTIYLEMLDAGFTYDEITDYIIKTYRIPNPKRYLEEKV